MQSGAFATVVAYVTMSLVKGRSHLADATSTSQSCGEWAPCRRGSRAEVKDVDIVRGHLVSVPPDDESQLAQPGHDEVPEWDIC